MNNSNIPPTNPIIQHSISDKNNSSDNKSNINIKSNNDINSVKSSINNNGINSVRSSVYGGSPK